MLSEAQVKTVWEQWLAAEMRANYFADLCATLNSRHRLATWAVLLLSSGAAVGFIGKFPLPAWIVPTLALLTAVVSLYSLVAQNPKAAAECSDLHSRWNRLGMEYEDLWMNWYADGAAGRLAKLNDRRAEVSKSGTPFRYDKKRMLKWYDNVVQHHTHAAAA